MGGFGGAWLADYFYNLTGSYNLMWWLSVALGLASAALPWVLSVIARLLLRLFRLSVRVRAGSSTSAPTPDARS